MHIACSAALSVSPRCGTILDVDVARRPVLCIEGGVGRWLELSAVGDSRDGGALVEHDDAVSTFSVSFRHVSAI